MSIRGPHSCSSMFSRGGQDGFRFIGPWLANWTAIWRRGRSSHRRDPDARFFVGIDKEKLPVNTASGTIRGLFQLAGVKPAKGRTGPRPYDMRHRADSPIMPNVSEADPPTCRLAQGSVPGGPIEVGIIRVSSPYWHEAGKGED